MTRAESAFIDDLKAQAMLFDMDIDWETLELVPPSTYKQPAWITRWKDKEVDFDTNFDIDRE